VEHRGQEAEPARSTSAKVPVLLLSPGNQCPHHVGQRTLARALVCQARFHVAPCSAGFESASVWNTGSEHLRETAVGVKAFIERQVAPAGASARQASYWRQAQRCPRSGISWTAAWDDAQLQQRARVWPVSDFGVR
jgi:hypothetical protein